MSLITAVAPLLLLALLQCSAFRLNAHQGANDDFIIKKFILDLCYDDDGEVCVRGSQAVVFGSDGVSNVTAWDRISGPKFIEVRTKIAFDSLRVRFQDAEARLGGFHDNGALDAVLDHQVMNLRLAAPISGKCKLKMQLVSPDLRPVINMTNLGDTGSMFQKIPFLLEEITTQMAESLEQPLPNLLTSVVLHVIGQGKKQEAICEAIRKSSLTSYPQPYLWGSKH